MPNSDPWCRTAAEDAPFFAFREKGVYTKRKEKIPCNLCTLCTYPAYHDVSRCPSDAFSVMRFVLSGISILFKKNGRMVPLSIDIPLTTAKARPFPAAAARSRKAAWFRGGGNLERSALCRQGVRFP